MLSASASVAPNKTGTPLFFPLEQADPLETKISRFSKKKHLLQNEFYSLEVLVIVPVNMLFSR